jgi:hypothetical protein
MAGFYDDAPNYRVPFDRDGTVGVLVDALNVATSVTPAVLQSLNNETGDTYPVNISAANFVIIFPELRDITHAMLSGYERRGIPAGNYSTTIDVDVSTDTTNGVDGTWSGLVASLSAAIYTDDPVKDRYRVAIQNLPATGVRAIRFNATNTFGGGETHLGKIHLYGEHAAGGADDRLRFWEPIVDVVAPPAYLDWGDMPRGTSLTRSIRVKNVSDDLTARSVRIAMEVLTDSTPSLIGQLAVSLDGVSWLAQVNVGDLDPGEISVPVQIRYTAAANAALSVWDARLFSEATLWEVV